MSDSFFETHLATLEAIPENSTRRSIPVVVYTQEAETLYHWAIQDADALQSVGLTLEFIESLPVRVRLLREAEARWQLEYRANKAATAEWVAQSPLAYELRDNLLRAFRYAFRKDDGLLQRVADIADGSSHADMIQDLALLAALGEQQRTQLEAINFDITQLQQAATQAETMASLLARSSGDKLEGNPGKILRDKAYIYLQEAVDEIRECGKYVFYANDARLKGYTSGYFRKHKKSTNTDEESVSA